MLQMTKNYTLKDESTFLVAYKVLAIIIGISMVGNAVSGSVCGLPKLSGVVR